MLKVAVLPQGKADRFKLPVNVGGNYNRLKVANALL